MRYVIEIAHLNVSSYVFRKISFPSSSVNVYKFCYMNSDLVHDSTKCRFAYAINHKVSFILEFTDVSENSSTTGRAEGLLEE